MGQHRYNVFFLKNPNKTNDLTMQNLVSMGFRNMDGALEIGRVVEAKTPDRIIHYVVIKINPTTLPITVVLRKIGELDRVVKIIDS